ncbi:ATP-binding protein [Phycicoccus sonneratiae]|uniref:ATP-binding protein n=1 Tax=Phycicoccus sonneratiae TaxID=2807628 RepID=UPI001EF313D3|nr:ATP-binding protein [Phycicoccus sonneraticus]
MRLVRDGGERGTSCAVAGGRDLLRPRWSGLGGEVLLLGPGDPLDLALLGTHAPGPGPTAGPGRGLRVRDGREVQVVDPGSAPASPAPLGEVAPWTYRPLPARVGRRDLGTDPARGWLLGALAPDSTPWTWRPEAHGRRLLVLGPTGSGRSTALATLARSVAEGGRPVVLVGAHGPAGGTGRSGVEQLGPDDADRLVALRTAHPDLVVLVDDADRLDDAPVRPVLEEVLDLLVRDGGAAVVAASATALGSRFRGLDVTVARYGAGVLLRPRADDLALLGLPRADLAASPDDPPGRGLLVLDGRAAPLQVVVDDPSGAGVEPAGGPEVIPGRRTPRPEPAR